jgi:putative transposase
MVKDTYNSFVRYFNKLSKYPNRKSYKDKHKSFYVDPYKIGFTDKKVRLEKIANNQKSNRQVLNWVNMAETNRIPLNVKYYNPRVVYDGNNFYIVVGVDETITSRIKSDDRVIGIDLNNAEIVTSENKRYNQVTKSKQYKKILKRKKRLQRSLSRKYLVCNPENKKRFKLSKNYRKNKSLVIKLDKRLRNLRDNNHNEIITDILIKPPKIIVLEDIHVKEMSNKESRIDKDYKEKQASKYITEASYRKFRLLLENRVNKYETAIVIANQYYASSKTCSVCGNKQEMKVDKRTYICNKCGLILDRDLNAAINLANYININ